MTKMIRRSTLRLLTTFVLLAGLTPFVGAQDDPFNPKEKKDSKPAPAGGEDDPFNQNLKKKEEAKKNDLQPKRKTERVTVQDLISFKMTVSAKKVRRGETVRVMITGKPREGFHTYPIYQRTLDFDEAGLSSLTFKETPGLRPLVPLTESKPELISEGKLTVLEYRTEFSWSQDILVLPDAALGAKTVNADVNLQVCDERKCTRGEISLAADFEVSDAPAVSLTDEYKRLLQAPRQEIAIVPVSKPDGPASKPGSKSDDTGLLAFMLAGVFWGAVSLITPCVFPMIPITVSFFLKQSEKEHHRPIVMASVYCLTIVVVLTISAVALLSLFREFSTSPFMNMALGLLFVFFALSLFGMYEIELPSGLARFTSSREGRGGLLGTMFMALTFTIISFACVAPFLGGFGGTAASSGITWLHRVLGGLAFSVTFASPFFVLALFPALLKTMPKSGNWLNSVKVVMGFLEIAAALKFFRQAEKVLLPETQLFTYDFVLGLYVALSVVCGLYLLNLFRLPHDTPSEHLSVPQMLVSLIFLGFAFYVAPALFKAGEQNHQRPTGAIFAWIDSFLLPDTRSNLPWTGTLDKGLARARAEEKLVFVDFTGETCTNCKLNEENVFSKPEVQALLKRFALVQLYTDKVPNDFYSAEERAKFGISTTQQRADAAKNLAFQRSTFDTEQLPLYVILKPLADGTFEEIARYDEGKINDENGFVQFLKQPLAKKDVAQNDASILVPVADGR